MNLDEKEERFKFLLDKIEGEITKFKELKNDLNKKNTEILNEINKTGLLNVKITFAANDQENILELLSGHLLELENMKSYIESQLDKLKKQKQLMQVLDKKYKDKISIVEDKFGGFKVVYDDELVESTFRYINVSKKVIGMLKEGSKKDI